MSQGGTLRFVALNIVDSNSSFCFITYSVPCCKFDQVNNERRSKIVFSRPPPTHSRSNRYLRAKRRCAAAGVLGHRDLVVVARLNPEEMLLKTYCIVVVVAPAA
jgi:hypothetical protein